MRKLLQGGNLLWILVLAIAQMAVMERALAGETRRQGALGTFHRTSAEHLLAQGITRVTGVEVIQTESGLELVLETVARSERLVPLIVPEGNNLVIDILDATLAFELRNGVTELNPVPGITKISVNKAEGNSIQVRITGENQTPSAEVVTGREDLVLSIAPSGATTEPPFEGKQELDESIEIIATGEGVEDDYFVPNASTATRTDTSILDTPASIQVVPQQVLEDQQVIRIEEALSNISGVTYGGSFVGIDVDFSIRGFDNAPIFRDGFRQFGFGNDGIPETANLERVEVLKGPASILYGEIEPGGVINLVTKQPLSEPSYEAQLQIGNRDFISPRIDFSAPLTSDKRLRYRLNALYRNEESFRDYEENIERFFIAPVVSWQIGDRTDLSLQLEYSDYRGPFEVGLPAIGDEVADVPIERVAGELDDFAEVELINVGYNLEHRFSDNWRVRNAFRYTKRDILDVGVIPILVDDATGILSRGFNQQVRDPEDFALQTNVVGEFATGSIEHTLLFGVDLNRSEETDTTNFSNFTDLQPLNIFDPVYGTFDGVDPETLPILRDRDFQADRLGIYLQDRIDILDNLILLAGVRYDTVEQTVNVRPDVLNPTAFETVQTDDAWIPRVGVVYQPIPEISLFGSYSQSFVPNNIANDASGEPLEPEEGEGFELGVKGEILEGKAIATLSYFNITKQNVATPDPIDPFASLTTGEQQSQGIELDFSGEIMPGWNIIASYAYIDAEVTEDNDIPVGNRLFNTPEHGASLWTTYEIQQGSLQGLGFGGGFNFVGEREGDLANSFTVDSYFLTNAAVFYERNDWRLALNFKNIFDVDYIASTRNMRANLNEPGAPFTVIGSVSVEF